MGNNKKVATMSTDELLATMREMLETSNEVAVVEQPKALDFTGFGAVRVESAGSPTDAKVVKDSMKRIEQYEADIARAEHEFAYGVRTLSLYGNVFIDHVGDEERRDMLVSAARRAITEEYEALNLRLTVHARLREHGLID